MSYADRNLKLVDLAIAFGGASKRLGMALGGGMPDGIVNERNDEERAAWQAFSDALWGKNSPTPTDVPGGVKSTLAEAMGNGGKIHS